MTKSHTTKDEEETKLDYMVRREVKVCELMLKKTEEKMAEEEETIKLRRKESYIDGEEKDRDGARAS